MSAAVFQSSGLAHGPLRYPALGIGPGVAAGWMTPDHTASTGLMDLVLGLRTPPPGAAVWFGTDFAAAPPGDILQTLRRLAPLTAAGGLIGNLNLGDNIMLPVTERHPRGRLAAAELLDRTLDEPPWPGWFEGGRLTCLPYQATPLELFLAGVLRARLLAPEAIVACHVFHLIEHRARTVAAEALAWLRLQLPECAWLFLHPESPLPAGFPGNTLAPER